MKDLQQYGKTIDERKRLLRAQMRVIRGGKESVTPRFDRTQLEKDPFLREHFIGKAKKPEMRLNEQLKFFLFGMGQETSPEAG